MWSISIIILLTNMVRKACIKKVKVFDFKIHEPLHRETGANPERSP
jgi:hypothetical protein